jgi:hypothetical protein
MIRINQFSAGLSLAPTVMCDDSMIYSDGLMQCNTPWKLVTSTKLKINEKLFLDG